MRSLLVRGPDDEGYRLAHVRPRNLPAAKCRKVNSDNHKVWRIRHGLLRNCMRAFAFGAASYERLAKDMIGTQIPTRICRSKGSVAWWRQATCIVETAF